MKLGEFDEKRALAEATTFLAQSIYTLSKMMGIDVSLISEQSDNPYGKDSPFHIAFDCLKQEVIAWNRLTEDHDERD